MFDCLDSFSPCLMGLRCPLLRGSSDCRLRRCAATLPPLLERTFPGSVFFSAFAEVMAAVRDWTISIFVWARLRNQMLRGRGPVYTSRLIRRIEGVVVSCGVGRIPAVEGAYIHWDVDIGDGSDGSGDSGLKLLSFAFLVLFAIAIVARMLKGLGGRFKSFRLGGTIGSCRLKPYGIVGSLDSSLIVKI